MGWDRAWTTSRQDMSPMALNNTMSNTTCNTICIVRTTLVRRHSLPRRPSTASPLGPRATRGPSPDAHQGRSVVRCWPYGPVSPPSPGG